MSWPGTDDVRECPSPVRVRGTEASVPVDIIMVMDKPCKGTVDVDGSLSLNCFMLDHAHVWRELFSDLWAGILDNDVDALVVAVAREPDDFAPRAGFAARFIPIQPESNLGFQGDPFIRFLSAIHWFRGSLRPGANTHIVLVSDGYLSSDVHYSAEEFLALAHELVGDVTVHAVTSPQLPLTPENPRGVCATPIGYASYVSPWYDEAARASGGLSYDICTQDWAPLIDTLTERVAVREPIPCAVTLPRIPPLGRARYQPDDFVVRATTRESTLPWILPRAEDECAGGGEGWWFVPIANQVHFCPRTCATLEAYDATVDIDVACL